MEPCRVVIYILTVCNLMKEGGYGCPFQVLKYIPIVCIGGKAMDGMRDFDAASVSKTALSIRLVGLLGAQLCVYSTLSALCFACPLYLLDRSGSSTLYGAVAAIAFIPGVLATPAGGVLADREGASQRSSGSRYCFNSRSDAVCPHEVLVAPCGRCGGDAVRPIRSSIYSEADTSN